MSDKAPPWIYWPALIVCALVGGFASGFVWDLIRSGVCR